MRCFAPPWCPSRGPAYVETPLQVLASRCWLAAWLAAPSACHRCAEQARERAHGSLTRPDPASQTKSAGVWLAACHQHGAAPHAMEGATTAACHQTATAALAPVQGQQAQERVGAPVPAPSWTSACQTVLVSQLRPQRAHGLRRWCPPLQSPWWRQACLRYPSGRALLTRRYVMHRFQPGSVRGIDVHTSSSGLHRVAGKDCRERLGADYILNSFTSSIRYFAIF